MSKGGRSRSLGSRCDGGLGTDNGRRLRRHNQYMDSKFQLKSEEAARAEREDMVVGLMVGG